MLEILLGQVPEAIYFALFIIFTKQLKEKRIIFVLVTILEYVLLFNIRPFTIWIHVAFFVVTYLLLKILYKEKSQIIDVFTLMVASLTIIIASALCYFVMWNLSHNYILTTVVNRFVLFAFLFGIRNKLPNIQNLYKHLWNRNDKIPKHMKSTTFRALNMVLFNLMFIAINIGLLYLYIK